jgi:hypothetical protein
MNNMQYSFNFLIWLDEVYLVYSRISNVTKDLMGWWYHYSSYDNEWILGRSLVDMHKCFMLFFQKYPLSLDFYPEATILSGLKPFKLIKANNINIVLKEQYETNTTT